MAQPWIAFKMIFSEFGRGEREFQVTGEMRKIWKNTMAKAASGLNWPERERWEANRIRYLVVHP